MIKFIDILEAYGANFKENYITPKLDTPVNRKLMNILSQKFDFDYFRNAAEKWSLGSKRHIFFNRYFKGDEEKTRDLPYNNMNQFMKDSLFLDDDKINELAFLLITNLKVENWLTDPILEPYDYYFYELDYYDDYVSDEEDEDCQTCDECGGSGYEDEDCGYCDGEGETRYECDICNGEGSIRDDEGDEEQCDECDGSGNEELECDECHGDGRSNEDCHWCGGDTEVCDTTYFHQINEMRIKLISPVKLPGPGEKVGNYYTKGYTDWYEAMSEIKGVIVLSHDTWDVHNQEYDIDNDSHDLDIYKKTDRIVEFYEHTLKGEMEDWRFDQHSHPFKSIMR